MFVASANTSRSYYWIVTDFLECDFEICFEIWLELIFEFELNCFWVWIELFLYFGLSSNFILVTNQLLYSPSLTAARVIGTNLSMNKFVLMIVLFLFVNINVLCVPPIPSTTHMRSETLVSYLQIGIVDILSLIVLCVCLFLTILSNIDLNCRFIPFDTSLNTLTASIKGKSNGNVHLYLLSLYLVIFEYYFIVFLPPEFYKNHYDIRWVSKKLIFFTKIFHSSFASCTQCLCCKLAYFVYVNITWVCHYPLETLTIWIFSMRLILCPDIHPNPGPTGNNFAGGFFSFCNWNLNTLSKDDFSRINLLEAHNTEYNYDIISLCETSLDDKAEVPEMTGYKFFGSA